MPSTEIQRLILSAYGEDLVISSEEEINFDEDEEGPSNKLLITRPPKNIIPSPVISESQIKSQGKGKTKSPIHRSTGGSAGGGHVQVGAQFIFILSFLTT